MSGTREIHFEDTVYEYLSVSNLYTTRKSDDFNLAYVLDKALLELYAAGKISHQVALANADSENNLRLMINFLEENRKNQSP